MSTLLAKVFTKRQRIPPASHPYMVKILSQKALGEAAIKGCLGPASPQPPAQSPHVVWNSIRTDSPYVCSLVFNGT